MDTATGYISLVRAFKLALTVDGLKPRTISNYVRDVQQFARHMAERPMTSVTATDLREYVVAMKARCADKTVHEAQLGLRRFYRFLKSEHEIDRDPTENIKLTRYDVIPQPAYSDAEIKRMVMVCDIKTREGIRDRAMLMVLYDTGVREGELVSMGLPDWDRQLVRVDGKTGVRDVPLGMSTVQALERYVRKWPVTEAPLWRGRKGRMTESGAYQVIGRVTALARVEDKGVHAFRRAAAAQMKRLGMNDSDILEVMGWTTYTCCVGIPPL